MIGMLGGIVVNATGDRVVVDVGGVGYEISVTAKTAAALRVGDTVTVHTHLHVREDALTLYGFASPSERDLFRVMLGVSGVGPKVAQAVLSVLAPDALRLAIATDDVDALTQVPGIGKRGAQKILLDLKPKLADLEAELLDGAGSERATVRQALEALGYTGPEIREVVPALDHDAGVEAQIREALALLAKERRR